MHTDRRARHLGLLVATLAAALGAALPAGAAGDPLPSWNDGAAKQAIVAFVAETTRPGAPGFVPPAERIATFDNDGTLWAEQPMYFQLAFAVDRVKALAEKASPIGRLDKALDEATVRKWTVVDMKGDWKRVFAFEK